jgi:cell division transport system permease protein
MKLAAKKNQSKQSSRNKPSLKNYILQHGLALQASLKRLWDAPLASFFTMAVIGIALALPASLYVLVQNIQSVSRGLDDGVQVSLFLETGISDQQANGLLQQIRQDKDVAAVKYISPAQGLSDFQKQSGFGDVFAQLHNNPLPGVIIVHPVVSVQKPMVIQALVQRLQALPQVDIAQLDMSWVKRLYALINLGQHAVLVLSILLGFAVILIIGNTIRLNVQNHRAEIEVIKLLGASNGFICRPYLYIGVLYGLAGAALAYLLIISLVLMLNSPAENLANLYQIHFSLQGLTPIAIGILLLFGGCLGFSGSWLAVAWQTRSQMSSE